jgi:hypothetical protein
MFDKKRILFQIEDKTSEVNAEVTAYYVVKLAYA